MINAQGRVEYDHIICDPCFVCAVPHSVALSLIKEGSSRRNEMKAPTSYFSKPQQHMVNWNSPEEIARDEGKHHQWLTFSQSD